MNKEYTKILYQSEPIGKEKIILKLTTLDLDAFKDNEELEKIPTKELAKVIERPICSLADGNDIKLMEIRINNYIKEIYGNQIEEMKEYIEQLRAIKIVPMVYDKNVKNISNADDVHCNIVYGNISNCDNIYCHEIKGNVTNCDKIIYK